MLNFQEVDQSAGHAGDAPVNQRIRLRQLGVSLRGRPKSLELLEGILSLVCGQGLLKIRPAFRDLGGEPVLFCRPSGPSICRVGAPE